MRILAAMSGGVDSAVAAARAVEAGHDVVGVHLALSRAGGTLRTGSRGCCTVEDAMDARRVADVLGIPFYVWDFSERFRHDVVDDFIAEYRAGRTPNPCMRCNQNIKFAALLERGLELGFDAVCTGHYAKLVDGTAGRELHRASEAAKDQSYVLGVLTESQLARAMFPLGSSLKSEVRAEAAQRGLSVAEKPDSHDICFVADGRTQAWLEQRLGARPGQVVDEQGDVLGAHTGAYGFTVGQRKGLHIGRPAADGRPRYVLDIQPASGTVVVGPAERLDVHSLRALQPRWCADAPVGEVSVLAQVRAHGDAVPALAEVVQGPRGPELRVDLHEPVRGVAPGQSVVLYDGTRVLGAATIASAAR